MKRKGTLRTAIMRTRKAKAAGSIPAGGSICELCAKETKGHLTKMCNP